MGFCYYAKTLQLYRQPFVEFHKRPFQMKIRNEKINYYHDKITKPNYSAWLIADFFLKIPKILLNILMYPSLSKMAESVVAL